MPQCDPGWSSRVNRCSVCFCSILSAPPTAELEPLTDGQVSQTDEVRTSLRCVFTWIFIGSNEAGCQCDCCCGGLWADFMVTACRCSCLFRQTWGWPTRSYRWSDAWGKSPSVAPWVCSASSYTCGGTCSRQLRLARAKWHPALFYAFISIVRNRFRHDKRYQYFLMTGLFPPTNELKCLVQHVVAIITSALLLKQGDCHVLPGGPESEALLPDVFDQPSQDDHHDTVLPRGDLQSHGPTLWPQTVPV